MWKRNLKRNNMLKFSEIHEALALDDVNKTPGDDDVSVVMGRFQPLTIAHAQIIENAYKKYKRKVVVAVVKSKNEKSPFPFKLVSDIIKKSVKVPIEVIEIGTGFVGDFISPLRDKGIEPRILFAGSDRVKGYAGQVKRYQQMFNLQLDVEEIPRVASDTSASKVRAAIQADDEALFQSMTPEGEHKFYKKLKGLL
jgi:citrate lyase synthetase